MEGVHAVFAWIVDIHRRRVWRDYLDPDLHSFPRRGNWPPFLLFLVLVLLGALAGSMYQSSGGPMCLDPHYKWDVLYLLQHCLLPATSTGN